jgi:hypothetical protein
MDAVLLLPQYGKHAIFAIYSKNYMCGAMNAPWHHIYMVRVRMHLLMVHGGVRVNVGVATLPQCYFVASHLELRTSVWRMQHYHYVASAGESTRNIRTTMHTVLMC